MTMQLKRSRWLILAGTVVMALATARLGFWQLDRAAQKIALKDAQLAQRGLPALDTGDLPRDSAAPLPLHRAVRLQGRWSAAHTVYLENRQMKGRPGFYVLTPLLLDDGKAVLVQRGWQPRDMADRTRVAAVPTAAGRVQLQGRIAPSPSRLYDFAGAASGAIRQNLVLGEFARETGLDLLPYSVLQEQQDPAGQPDGLLRDWPQPAADVHKHYGYAFQWFALSTLVIGLYVWFQFVSPRFAGRRAP